MPDLPPRTGDEAGQPAGLRSGPLSARPDDEGELPVLQDAQV